MDGVCAAACPGNGPAMRSTPNEIVAARPTMERDLALEAARRVAVMA